MTEGAFEARKISYRQTKDGMVIAFAIHPNDVPLDLMNAPIGTIFAIGYREMPDGDTTNSAAPSADVGTEPHARKAGMDTDTAPSEAVADGAPRFPVSECPRRWSDIPLAQQAGIRINDRAFQQWLGVLNADEADRAIKAMLAITSKRLIEVSPRAAAAWNALDMRFQQETGRMPS